MATIRNGQYQVGTAGGLQQGRYRVEVEVKEKTSKKAMVDSGFEKIEAVETVLTSSPEYAGENSPLTYTAEPVPDPRFDIDVPTK
jgi:hypothetical protein